MKIQTLKTIGVLTLIGISISLTISLNIQITKYKGKVIIDGGIGKGWAKTSSIFSSIFVKYSGASSVVHSIPTSIPHSIPTSIPHSIPTSILHSIPHSIPPAPPDLGVVIRNVILSQNIEVEGRAIKIRLDNMSSTIVLIDSANIMIQISGPDGDVDSRTPIPFINAGGTADGSVTIGAASYVESDWFLLPNNMNFDKSRNYLVSFHIGFSGFVELSSWSAGNGSEQSYIIYTDSTAAEAATWQGVYTYTTKDIIYVVESIKVSYFSSGTLTSQVYDTGMDQPAYTTLEWKIAKNNYAGGAGADLIIRVRSNNDKDALLASSDWSAALAIDTFSAQTGSANIAAIGTGRYVQFQAEFRSLSMPYSKSCVLKSLTISWPGETRTVDISGYFTQRPDYGIFSVKVDGQTLTKAVEIASEISEKVSADKTITKSLTAEVEPRNTGK